MFKKAIPVFAEGKEKEMNYHLVLRAVTESLKDTVLFISAFSFYRLTVNGSFVSFGPARTAKGYARVDEIALDAYGAKDGENEIIIEAVGYNCGSLSTVRQTSFVVAELRRGDDVLLYTGRDFCGYRSGRMIQKTERYSAQRHFGEIHTYTVDSHNGLFGDEVKLVAAENRPSYLQRKAPTPTFDVVDAEEYSSFGEFNFDDTIPYRKKRSSFEITEEWGCFPDDQVFSKPYRWIQRQRLDKKGDDGEFPIELKKGDYVIVDMGRIETGFLTVNMTARDDSEVVLGFSEMCFDADFEFTNINSQNVIEYFVEAGAVFSAESFEPYTCRFAIITVKQGRILLRGFGIRTFEYPTADLISRDIKDVELRKIYTAAERTFAHNAVDLYTDCPSRERAGWLCDSFFTGRSEYFLTGKTLVEDAFLENYRLYKNERLPDGMIPMCYPSDLHDNDKFIPQWAMWYVLEVKEYLTERNRSVDKELFRDSVLGIVGFLERYENAEGLLQNLPSWNFVEWSTANEWVQDVNYPTNFLYAEVLRSAYALYGDESLIKKAERVARITAEKSFDGEVFIDNAVLDENGNLQNTRNSSEAGQYYAILFGDFDINEQKYAKLKKHICNGFSQLDIGDRGFVPVNAFIGFYVKICALMKLEWLDILESDIKSFFGGMVEATGTLWEYKQHKGSYDHGFASFAAIAIDAIEKKKK